MLNISPTETLPTGFRWDSTVFGRSAIFTNGAGAPFARQVSDVGPIERMPNWPEDWSTDLIRSYRNFLVAMKVTKDGIYDDTRIQWSNASPNNGLPPDWDELDPASLAGGTSLAGDKGPIIDGATLGQSFLIYLQEATWAMALGGATVMTFRPLLNQGLLSRGCVIPFDVYHFCIGNGVIYVHDGSSIQYPADDRTQRRFFRELADQNDIRLAHDSSRRTIDIFYKSDAELDLPDRSLRWNYRNGTWTFVDWSGYGVVRAKFAPDAQNVVTWDSIDAELGGGSPVAWSDLQLAWSDLGSVEGALSFKLMLRNDEGDALFRLEEVMLRDGEPFQSVVEREFIDFDDLIPQEQRPRGLRTVMHIKRILPQVRGTGRVYFQFGTAMTPNGPTEWGNIIPYEIETDHKVDFRASGRYFAWRMYSDPEAPVSFRLSGFDIDAQVAGER